MIKIIEEANLGMFAIKRIGEKVNSLGIMI